MIAVETLAMLQPLRAPSPNPAVTDSLGRPITRIRRRVRSAGVWRCFVGDEFVGEITASDDAIWQSGLWQTLDRAELLAALARLGRGWGKPATVAAAFEGFSDQDLVTEVWRRLPREAAPIDWGRSIIDRIIESAARAQHVPISMFEPGTRGRLEPTTEPGADFEFVPLTPHENVRLLEEGRPMPGIPNDVLFGLAPGGFGNTGEVEAFYSRIPRRTLP